MVEKVREHAKAEGPSRVIVSAQVTRARRSNRAPPRRRRAIAAAANHSTTTTTTTPQPITHHQPPPPPQVESELVEPDDAERADFLESLGVSDVSERPRS